MPELRLIFWNVRSLRDDAAAVAEVIETAQVDVAAVVEAPRFARWRSRRAALARGCGLLVATTDRVGGLLVMTSLRTWVDATSHVELPRGGNDRHRRALVTARVRVGDGPDWTVGVTHLSVDPGQRLAQADAVRRELAGSTAPVVLAADVNDVAGSAAWDRLADGMADAGATGAAPTFPSSAPQRRIDAVFAGSGVEVVETTVVDTGAARRASDHLPVLVTVRVAGQPGR